MRVVNILYVDNVDNLFLKQVFADFYYISGTHCYHDAVKARLDAEREECAV